MERKTVVVDKIVRCFGKRVVDLAMKSAKLSVNSACTLAFYEFEQPKELERLKIDYRRRNTE